MPPNAYTAQEDAYLRRRLHRDGAQACALALGRSTGSIRMRAHRLALRKKPRWSERDDAVLRNNWGDLNIATLAELLGRTETAVYWRAGELGLQRGCPPGFEYLSAASARSGYSTDQVRKLLAWYGSKVRRSLARRDRPRFYAQHIVDPIDVDDAIAAWHLTETVNAAAARHGVAFTTLQAWLRAASRSGAVMPKDPGRYRQWRIPTETIDAVVAARKVARLAKARAVTATVRRVA